MHALSAENRPIAIASLFVLVILALGTAYTLTVQGTASFLSPTYLLQQLQVGSFLGIVAAGMMLVILMGHIDLSRALDAGRRRHDGDRRGRPAGDPDRARASASSSASSTAWASPTCACRR